MKIIARMKEFIKKIIKRLVTSKSLVFVRKIIFLPIYYGILCKKGVIVYYNDPKRSKIFDLIEKIKSENEMLLENNEAYQIFMAVKRTAKVRGDIAEVGTYKGSSAKLICEARSKKTVHLFDTYDGLPDLCKFDDATRFYKGQFMATFNNVKTYLGKYSNIFFYKGIFPSTGASIKSNKFSFVHLDVDICSSTLNCLKFFYPRMNKGGVIISHDYINSVGVKKAFDIFFKDKPEPIIEPSGSQCLIVKC